MDEAEASEELSEPGEDLLPSVMPMTFTLLGSVAGLALLTYAITAASVAQAFRVLSAGLLAAVASLIAGGLLGFLFGIPRSLQDPDASADRASALATRANTNLEQISDWLTKILVGVGLTQIGEIAPALEAVGASLAPAFGGAPGAEAVVLAAIVSFLGGGFMLGYVWTRVYLPGAFRWAEGERRIRIVEQDVREAEQRATEAMSRLDEERMRERESARAGLERDAHEYRLLRQQQSGPGRTLSMTNVIASMRHRVRHAELTPEEVEAWARSADEGSRISALASVQDEPDPRLAAAVTDMVAEPKSAFEQYQALRAAEQLASLLDDDAEREKLRAVVEEQFSSGWLQVGKNENAMPLGSAVLAALNARDSER